MTSWQSWFSKLSLCLTSPSLESCCMEANLGPGYYSKSAKLLVAKGQMDFGYEVEPIQTNMFSLFLVSVVQ